MTKHPDWLKGLTRVVYTPTRIDQEERQPMPVQHSGPGSMGGDEKPATLRGQVLAEFKAFFLDTKLNLLMLAFPFAVISKLAQWGEAITFILSMAALCPLAERLGFVTEQLAMYTNDTLGGLLNASFGNATELIISGFALKAGYVRIVQLSLLGSVISNLLLVLGSAFIAGGIRNPVQTFNQQGVNVNCALLFLGVIAVLLPSLLSETQSEVTKDDSELVLSRFESVFLLLIYAFYLLFQLVTHRFLYDEDASKPGEKDKTDKMKVTGTPNTPTAAAAEAADMEEGRRVPPLPPSNSLLQRLGSKRRTEQDAMAIEMARPSGSRTSSGRPAEGSNGTRAGVNGGDLRESLTGSHLDLASSAYHAGSKSHRGGSEDGEVGPAGRPGGASIKENSSDGGAGGDADEEELVLSKVGCFLWLAGVTGLIALLSEWIVDAIKPASKAIGMPMPFLVTIVLPIVGNAAEHASAIVFAYKNRIEIALGVAIGSSTQVAVLIVPFCVVLAWMMGQPLDLNFNAFESAVYFFSIIIAAVSVQDGSANWLKGLLLLVTYFLIAAGFWMHKDVFLEQENVDGA